VELVDDLICMALRGVLLDRTISSTFETLASVQEGSFSNGRSSSLLTISQSSSRPLCLLFLWFDRTPNDEKTILHLSDFSAYCLKMLIMNLISFLCICRDYCLCHCQNIRTWQRALIYQFLSNVVSTLSSFLEQTSSIEDMPCTFPPCYL
jgi:hypothetical protein